MTENLTQRHLFLEQCWVAGGATLAYNKKKKKVKLVHIEYDLVTAFIPSSVLSLYQLVRFTVALVVRPPHYVQSPRHVTNVPSAHPPPPPPLTHPGGLTGDRDMRGSCSVSRWAVCGCASHVLLASQSDPFLLDSLPGVKGRDLL